MTSIENLQDALIEELRDLLSAEKQLTKALPKLAKHASDDKLKKAFESHLKETEKHIERLEKSLELLGRAARSKKCEAMAGLISEGQDLIDEGSDGTGDALLIAAAQKVEHYEIASYGTAVAWAKLMKLTEIVDLLDKTLSEENAADEKLTEIARSANQRAMQMAEA